MHDHNSSLWTIFSSIPIVTLGLFLISSSVVYFNHEVFARCPNGYHKSPSGDCEKVTNTKGLTRCPNGYHRSPSGDCEKVGGSGGTSKKCSSGYHKDDETGKCKKVDKKQLPPNQRGRIKTIRVHRISQMDRPVRDRVISLTVHVKGLVRALMGQ